MPRQYKNPGPLKFKGTIRRNTDVNNSSAWIEFPYDLKETFGVGNLIPFKATFDSRVEYRGSLAKMGGDHAMLLLRKDIRAAINKEPGDTVEVVVELDDKPREVEVPKELKDALNQAGLWEYFNGLAFTHRREYAQYISNAKRPETRVSRMEKTLKMLTDKQKKS